MAEWKMRGAGTSGVICNPMRGAIIIIIITRAGQGCGPDDLIVFVQCLLGGQYSLFICH